MRQSLTNYQRIQKYAVKLAMGFENLLSVLGEVDILHYSTTTNAMTLWRFSLFVTNSKMTTKNNITLADLEIEASEPKEEGYDEWLRARLERTIQLVDSGKMPTYSMEEVEQRLAQRRAERRANRAS
jgi:hypothetical protein